MRRLLSFIIIFSCTLILNTSLAQQVPHINEATPNTQEKLSVKESLDAWYHIIAVDSISGSIKPSKENKPKYYSYLFDKVEKEQEAKSPLLLFIDTTQLLSVQKKPIWARYLFSQDTYNKKESDLNANDTLVKFIQAYPVFMINVNSDTIQLDTQDGSAIITCEVKNEQGEWQAIENWKSSWCGNSYFSYIIPPLHTAYTKMIAYSGTFKTTARLKLKNKGRLIYSNEINISVNPSQFVNVPKSAGN